MASFTLTCKDINEHGTEHRVEFDCNDFEDTNSLEEMKLHITLKLATCRNELL